MKKQSNKQQRKRDVIYIYVFAVAWMFFSFGAYLSNETPTPMIFLFIFLISFSFSLSVRIIVYIIDKFLSLLTKLTRNLKQDLIEDIDINSNQTDQILEITQAKKLIEKIDKIYLNDTEIIKSRDTITKISYIIIEKLSEKPSQIFSNRNFFDYYLPTTLNLIEKYNYLESYQVETEHIDSSKDKILKSVDMIKNSFEKKLDSIFKQTKDELDIDMRVLKDVLKSEGLH